LPNDELEIVAPLGSNIEIMENEIGSTYAKDGKMFLKLKQLLTQKQKVLESVHSGNTNPIVLPTKMPPYTFLRIPSHEDMGTYPKNNV
jgi:putative protease